MLNDPAKTAILMDEATKGFRAMLRTFYNSVSNIDDLHGKVTVSFRKGVPVNYETVNTMKHDELVLGTKKRGHG